RSCERPSTSSASAFSPSAVSKRYSFSIGTHGSSRRCCASSSPSLVCSFSRISSCSRARSHCSRVPNLRIGHLYSHLSLSFVLDSESVDHQLGDLLAGVLLLARYQ